MPKTHLNTPKAPKTTPKMDGQTLQILGVAVNSTSMDQVLEFIGSKLKNREKFWLATPNPEMVVLSQKDPEFQKILNSATVAIPDGQGLLWAAQILGCGTMPERVTGTDLMEKLCCLAAKENLKVFLLGGQIDAAAKALKTLQKRYPGLQGATFDGPHKLVVKKGKLMVNDLKRNQKTIKLINQYAPDLLFVGFGMGKQERWISKNLPNLKIGGALVVGGAFDFLSGKISRAPVWLRRLGLEWFWRLILQPWRIKRQMALLRFIFLVFKQRLSHPFALNAQ